MHVKKGITQTTDYQCFKNLCNIYTNIRNICISAFVLKRRTFAT